MLRIKMSNRVISTLVYLHCLSYYTYTAVYAAECHYCEPGTVRMVSCASSNAVCKSCEEGKTYMPRRRCVWSSDQLYFRLIAYLMVHRNFPLPRSACPIYFVTMIEW